ncbi:hypothetical protein [Mangrovibacterium sp.]|uniref:hypothetical protein n=1 Tax=Mangrovibacterium sp. TaxID=1961364 RepID=UPI0035683305
MNQSNWNQNGDPDRSEKKKGGSTLGVILIAIGAYWILKETGLSVHLLPVWEIFRDLFGDLFRFLHQHLGDLLLPILLLAAGLLLVGGKRKVGGLLVLIVLLIVIPGIFVPGVIAVFLFPVFIIILGILVIRSLL